MSRFRSERIMNLEVRTRVLERSVHASANLRMQGSTCVTKEKMAYLFLLLLLMDVGLSALPRSDAGASSSRSMTLPFRALGTTTSRSFYIGSHPESTRLLV